MRLPIRVITIEREYGSRGGEFAHDLATHLGWRLLDSELPCAAAHAAGVSPELAAKYDERLDPWYYRYGKVFGQDTGHTMHGLSADQVFDSERMQTLIRQQILDAAKEGNCVIVGRGAACALAGQPGCFHIFVYATARAKREWFTHAFPKQAQNADQLLASFDKRRAAVIRKFYQQEWCSRSLYHLLLNSAIGTHAMIAAVEGAAGLVTRAQETVAQ
jgi:cytidylate kinase